MGKFEGYLICSDCDGTLTDGTGQLSEKNAEAIRYFQEEGGLFTVSTGRFPRHILNFKEKFWPNTYQVVGNGTTIYDADNERMLHQVVLDPPPREVLEFMVEEGLCDLVYVDHMTYSDNWMRLGSPMGKTWDNQRKLTHDLEELFKDNPDLMEQEPWHKINFVFTSPEDCVRVQHIMQEKFPQYRFERSWATGMELLPMDGGKGPAVEKLREILGGKEKIHTIIGVGDYENDVSMLEMADIGYAVSNATELCLKAADRITVSNNENAIAVIIDELEAEIEAAQAAGKEEKPI